MGGKVWSLLEERVFWNYIVTQSPKRVGIDRANPEKSWAQLAPEMARRMGTDARRDYTELGLFEHFFQNAVKKRFSPNAYYWAGKYLEIEWEENNGPTEKKSDKDKKSPPTEQDATSSPQPSETELPPFHVPDHTSSTSPGSDQTTRVHPPSPAADEERDDGSSEGSENYTAMQATGHSSTYRPGLSSPNSPALSGGRDRTSQLASRLNRRGNTTARGRASKRVATSHDIEPAGTGSPAGNNPTKANLEDPFVDSSPHPRPSATSGEYNTPAAHHDRRQYSGAGYPPGDASATYGHGYYPLTGIAYDYTAPSNNAQDGQHPRRDSHIPAELAPPAEMYSPHPSGRILQANNTWDQHGYAGGYDTAYPSAGYHPDYQAAQPRYALPPIRIPIQEGFQGSSVTRRNQDVAHDDKYDWDNNRRNNHNSRGHRFNEPSEDLDAEGDEDEEVYVGHETPTPNLGSNFRQ